MLKKRFVVMAVNTQALVFLSKEAFKTQSFQDAKLLISELPQRQQASRSLGRMVHSLITTQRDFLMKCHYR
jgi:DNA-directed RNA polymerase specialized sigma54-like protein